MKVCGYYGTDRSIARQILVNYSWIGAESNDELGTGVYFYIDNDPEQAKYYAQYYPRGKREDPPDAVIHVLTSLWEEDSAFYLDFDNPSVKKLFLWYKNRYNANDEVKRENERYLKGRCINGLCDFLASLGKNVRAVKEELGLPNAYASYYLPYNPLEKALCVCVRDISVLSAPKKS